MMMNHCRFLLAQFQVGFIARVLPGEGEGGGSSLPGEGGGSSSMGVVAARGDSKSTNNGRESFKNAFGGFLQYQNQCDPSWPDAIEALTERQANDQGLYERYAFYLINDCVSSHGKPYALGTVKDYVRGAAQLMASDYGHSKLGNSLSKLEIQPSWMTRLVDNIVRVMSQKAYDNGENVSPHSTLLGVLFPPNFHLNILLH